MPGSGAEDSRRVSITWLRLAALALLEFAWTAKIVVSLLVFFNIAIVVDPRSPSWLKFALPALTLGLVLVLRRATAAPKREADEVSGVTVSPEQAPALCSLVLAARASVRGPRVRRIVVAHDASAYVEREKRRWGLGRRRILSVGFALIAASSEAELRGLMAAALRWERGLAHRAAASFARLADTYAWRLELANRDGPRSFLSRPFYRWFVPCFTEELGKLARARMLRAYRAAAEANGDDAVVSALVKSATLDAFLEEEFWFSVWARVADTRTAPDDVHVHMAEAISALGEHPACARWMSAGYDVERTFVPSLRRRLEALGAGGDLPDPELVFGCDSPAVPASELASLARRLTEHWAHAAGEEWRVRNAEHEEASARFEELGEDEIAGELDDDRLTAYAGLIDRFRGAHAAQEFYERAAAVRPSDALAQFHAGRLRLAAGDPTGLELLEQAIALDPDALLPACDLAEQALREMGKPEQAEAFASRSADHLARRLEAEHAASRLDRTDGLQPHDLEPAALAAIRDRARQLRDVDAIFLARKPLEGFPGEHRHIAVVLRRRPTFGLERSNANQRLGVAVNEAVPLPDRTTLYTTTVDDHTWLPLRRVPGAEVYRGSWKSTVKWPKVLFITIALAFFASGWTDEWLHQPAVSALVFALVAASVSTGLYLHERRRA